MNELIALFLFVASAAIVLWIVVKILPFKRVTVFEYQKALKYTQGRYEETLGPASIGYFPRGPP